MWTDDEVDARLYQRNAVWYVRDRRGGLDAKRSLQTRSRRDARKAAREWLIGRDALFTGQERITWSTAADTWTLHYLPGAVKESAGTRYIVSEKQISLYIAREAEKRKQADLYVDQIDAKLIMGFLRYRKQAGKSVSTRRCDMAAWSGIMSACVAEGWRDDNPVQTIDKRVMRVKHEPIRLPPMAEVEALIARAGPMKGALVDLLWRTGLRLEEAVHLRHEHWDRTEIRLFGDGTKTGKARVVPLSDPQDPAWMRAAAGTLAGPPRHFKSPYVFHHQGEPFAFMSGVLCRLRHSLGFTWKTHDLRHLFAVMYLRSFGDNPRAALYRLQQIMGHSSVTQTEAYLQFCGPDVQVGGDRKTKEA